jgi:hypothetical protein
LKTKRLLVFLSLARSHLSFSHFFFLSSNVTSCNKTASHYQALQNICVNVTHGSRRSYSQVLTIVYVNVTWWEKTASHSQVLQNVCVNLNVTHGSRRSYSQVLTIVYVNVTWWEKTASHSQVLQNVCVNVNVTHGSRHGLILKFSQLLI